jgi:2-polyprenyl-6-methoxyphenol hydroxylase-like FAD-dependent oxidoreductase
VSVERVERDVVIAGGGPAGVMLGYLLARAGLRVSVLEKHADFFRDFRGDTIHPSTLDLLGELGIRDRFLALPVSRLDTLDAVFDGERVSMVDFRTLPKPNDFLVMAPQWDLLNFLTAEAATLPGFELRLQTRAVGLLRDGRTVRGIRATGPGGDIEISAALSVAADGRSSTLRAAAGLAPRTYGVPIDVLWFRLPKPADAPPPTLAYLARGGMVLTLDRGDYYQSGMVIRKGGFDELHAAGLAALRDRIAAVAPVLAAVVDTLTDWDQIKLLSVQIDRLDRWHRDGFMAIGDAAHAMSPVGGVGVNYAIQDAVALANAVVPGLVAEGVVDSRTLAAVERRRAAPVRAMQRLQRIAHRGIARQASGGRLLPVWLVGALRAASPVVRRVTARVVGRGFRPEHVAPAER